MEGAFAMHRILQSIATPAIGLSLALFPNPALAQLFTNPTSDALVIEEAGRTTSGVFLNEVPGQDVVLSSDPLFQYTLQRTVNAGPGITDTLITLGEAPPDPDTIPPASDLLAMKVLPGINPGTLSLNFSFWSGDSLTTAAQFLAAVGLVAPRNVALPETGAAHDLSAALFPLGTPAPLQQVVVASDFNNQALNSFAGALVGVGPGFGAPFISDSTEFFAAGKPVAVAAGDEMPQPGQPLVNPEVAIQKAPRPPGGVMGSRIYFTEAR